MSDRETRLVAALQLAINELQGFQAAQSLEGLVRARGRLDGPQSVLPALCRELQPCPGCGEPQHDGGCPHSDQAEHWTAEEILAREG